MVPPLAVLDRAVIAEPHIGVAGWHQVAARNTIMTDRKPEDKISADRAADPRNAEAPETFNDSQRREDEQAQSVAADALARRASEDTADKRDDLKPD
jgi:hypothetical protein